MTWCWQNRTNGDTIDHWCFINEHMLYHGGIYRKSNIPPIQSDFTPKRHLQISCAGVLMRLDGMRGICLNAFFLLNTENHRFLSNPKQE